jgi:RNA polymerase sigma-70 factor, ECF subfamily
MNGALAPDRTSMIAITSLTSLTLLDRLRDSTDSDAWSRLDRLYTGLLRAWFARAGVQTADRDDLTQAALTIVLRRVSNFNHAGRPGSFRAWLRSIATNLLKEHWRARPTAQSDSILAELADGTSGLRQAWDAEHERYTLQGLMSLARPDFTEPTWQAFCRLALDGAVASEVAAELGMSANAVLIAKCRVLARLRELAVDLTD